MAPERRHGRCVRSVAATLQQLQTDGRLLRPEATSPRHGTTGAGQGGGAVILVGPRSRPARTFGALNALKMREPCCTDALNFTIKRDTG